MTTKTMPFPGDPRQPVLSCSHRQPPRPSLVCSTSISRRRRLLWMRHYPTNFPEARSRYRCVTRVNSPVTEPSYFPKVRWRGFSSHAPLLRAPTCKVARTAHGAHISRAIGAPGALKTRTREIRRFLVWTPPAPPARVAIELPRSLLDGSAPKRIS